MAGRKAQTPTGKNAGRIPEIPAEHIEGERVSAEFQLGPAALLSRLPALHLAAPLLPLLGTDKEQGGSRSKEVLQPNFGEPDK